MVVVTAADQRYFAALVNLVGSIHFWSGDTKIVVYDLGFSEKMLREIEKWQDVQLVSGFLERELPPHCREILSYAWKPLILQDVIQQEAEVLWVDAGSDIRAPLSAIDELLIQDGHFFVQGQDIDMTTKSHTGTYTYLGLSKQAFIGREHFSANLQGYVRDGKAHEKVLQPMCELSAIEACIAPPGSNLSNHRYDQSLLSILLYQSGISVTPHTEMLAYARHQLSANFEHQSTRAVFTARGSSREYRFCVLDRSGAKLYRSSDHLSRG